MTESRASTLRLVISLLAAGSASCAGCTDGAGARRDASMGAETGPTNSDAASDSGSSLTPDYKDGTRLRAQWWTHEGSEPVFAGWYDTELKVRCRFELTDGGRYRCLPLEFRGFVVGTREGACDAGGAVSVYYGYADASPGQLVATYGFFDSVCGDKPSFQAIYRIGERLDGATIPDCPNLGSRDRVFAEGTRLEMDDFVGADLALADVGDRLAVTMLVAQDDAQGPKSLYDTQRDHACHRMLPDSSGVYRCLPLGETALANGFRDATCTQDDLVEVLDYKCEAEVAIVGQLSPQGCETKNTFFEIGAPFKEIGYRIVGGQCVPDDPGGPSRHVRGAEFAPATFAGARLTSVGSGRLRPVQFTTAAGAILMPYLPFLHTDFRPEGVYRDQELDELCRPMLTTDGVRCVPVIIRAEAQAWQLARIPAPGEGGTWEVWRDDKCSAKPLHAVPKGECNQRFAFSDTSESGVGKVNALYSVGAPVQVDTTYESRGDNCVVGSPGVFQVAEEIPMSTLAGVRRTQ